MLNDLGKLLRKIRIDNGELLKEMADKLNVTASYLSAVETGKRNAPNEWIEILSEKYHITGKAYTELKKAVLSSKLNIKIDLNKMKKEDRNIALAFAREFKELDDVEKEKILQILNKKSK